MTPDLAAKARALSPDARAVVLDVAEHGDAPVNRDPMTDQERAALYHETFGRF